MHYCVACRFWPAVCLFPGLQQLWLESNRALEAAGCMLDAAMLMQVRHTALPLCCTCWSCPSSYLFLEQYELNIDVFGT